MPTSAQLLSVLPDPPGCERCQCRTSGSRASAAVSSSNITGADVGLQVPYEASVSIQASCVVDAASSGTKLTPVTYPAKRYGQAAAPPAPKRHATRGMWSSHNDKRGASIPTEPKSVRRPLFDDAESNQAQCQEWLARQEEQILLRARQQAAAGSKNCSL